MRKLLPALVAFAAFSPLTRAAQDQAPQTAPASAAEAAKKPAEEKPITPEQRKVFLQSIGCLIMEQTGISQFEFSEEDNAAILEGAKLALKGEAKDYLKNNLEPVKADFQRFNMDLQRIMAEKSAKKQAAELEKNKKAGKEFIEAAVKADSTVVVEPNGLAYKIVAPGAGDKPKADWTAVVKYTGKLVDGTIFDATEKHPDKAPSEFGLNQVIPGWTQGMQKIAKGGKIELWIPSELAYGEQGNPPTIPPGATLHFEVEMVDVKPPAPPAPAAPSADNVLKLTDAPAAK